MRNYGKEAEAGSERSLNSCAGTGSGTVTMSGPVRTMHPCPGIESGSGTVSGTGTMSGTGALSGSEKPLQNSFSGRTRRVAALGHMRFNKKGMEMVQVAILVAIAIALGIIFKTQITSFVNATLDKLSTSGF